MVLFGPKLSIEVFGGPYYTTGTNIAGAVVIETKSSFSLLRIDVMLRCRERVSLITLNGSSAYRSSAIWQRLSLRSTVFPSSFVLASSDERTGGDYSSELPQVIAEPEEIWRNPSFLQVDSSQPETRFTQTYTMKKGVHKLPFEFQIPLGLPSSVKIDDENGIFWLLEARIHRQGMLSLEKATSMPIQVYKGGSVSWNPSNVATCISTREVKIPSMTSQAAKKWHEKAAFDMVPVVAHLYTPADGFLQAPNPLGFSLIISSEREDLLLIETVDIYLRRRAYAKTETGTQQEFIKQFPILKLERLNAPFKVANEKISASLRNATLNASLSETLRSSLVTIAYKLVAEFVVVSREKPQQTEKLKIATPINVYSARTSRAEGMSNDREPLPRYSPE